MSLSNIWDKYIKDGYLNGVKYFVKNDIHDLEDFDYELSRACDDGNLELVKIFVEHGADIHYDDDYGLHTSAEHGYHFFYTCLFLLVYSFLLYKKKTHKKFIIFFLSYFDNCQSRV
jgi:hypothetical protein